MQIDVHLHHAQRNYKQQEAQDHKCLFSSSLPMQITVLCVTKAVSIFLMRYLHIQKVGAFLNTRKYLSLYTVCVCNYFCVSVNVTGA